MATGAGQGRVSVDPGLTALALRLLRRARAAAWAALASEFALVLLFLWGMNPSNLLSAASVLVQSDLLIAPVSAAMLLPVLTVVWVGWVLQSVEGGNWGPARRLLPAITVLGYFSLIAPGHFLLETLHLIHSPAWVHSAGRQGQPTS